MRRNFKVKMSYLGTNYHGFQIQDNAVTVQETVEKALSSLLNEDIKIFGCSRTDTGVHAREFSFNFYTENTINERGIIFGGNARLPEDIALHTRYDCKGKEYEYIIHNSEIKSPFMADRAYKSWFPIDDKRLDRAAKLFVGEHDFKSFCSTDCDKENTVREIYAFDVRRDGELVIFTVSGSGFLYNMVRILVGTLLFINDGKLNEKDIERIFLTKDRTMAGKTVPPQGLYLNKVFY